LRGAKTQIRVSIDKELVEEARRLGINLAKTCEWAIRSRVAAIRTLKGIGSLEKVEPSEQ
jgi:post-segregation antitoxin (ccd killing protein)